MILQLKPLKFCPFNLMGTIPHENSAPHVYQREGTWDHIEGTATKPTDDTKMAHWETRLIGSLAL